MINSQLPPVGANQSGVALGGTQDARSVSGAKPEMSVAEILNLVAVRTGGQDSVDLPLPKISSMGLSSAGSAVEGLNMTAEADIYAVMALFQQLAQQMRTSSRELRASEQSKQIGELKNAAQEIRNAAQERFTGAVIAGALQIAAGATQIGFGVASGAMGFKAARAEYKATQLKTEAGQISGVAGAKAQRAELRNQALNLETSAKQSTAYSAGLKSGGDGAAGMLGGMGHIAQAAKDRDAAEHDAKRSEFEADAKVHDEARAQANEQMQHMLDTIRDVREKLGAIEQSRLETNRGIARNI